jgi:hypothetical protein
MGVRAGFSHWEKEIPSCAGTAGPACQASAAQAASRNAMMRACHACGHEGTMHTTLRAIVLEASATRIRDHAGAAPCNSNAPWDARPIYADLSADLRRSSPAIARIVGQVRRFHL